MRCSPGILLNMRSPTAANLWNSWFSRHGIVGTLCWAGIRTSSRTDLQSSMTLAMYLRDQGREVWAKGGMNFDAKIRRQSIDPEDLIHAHIGGDRIDVLAHSWTAARLFEEGHLAREVAARYAGWETPQGRAMLSGELSLDEIAARAEAEDLTITPRSRPPGAVGKSG